MKDKETISCEEALKLVFDYLDEALDDAEYCDIEDHLSVCRACYSRVDFERRLKDHLKEIGQEEAPAELQDRIRGIVQKY